MTIGICGTGYQVPALVRTNDDPLFSLLTRSENAGGVSEADLFTGMKERRVLATGEPIEPLMVEAARQALMQAGIGSAQIDRLYGYASVSPYLTPNALYAIHHDLHLSPETMVIPINSEFSNFVLGIVQAWEAIAAGHSTTALVVCGSNWTQYMDYTQGHSVSLGDGAGAAVVGHDPVWELIDYATETRSEQYGVMRMRQRSIQIGDRQYLPLNEEGSPYPTYEITPNAGIHSFQVDGMHGPPALVHRLLQKHGLQGKDIALITHQASRVLLDTWIQQICPRQHLETFEVFGNLGLAAYPVNLAYFFSQITTEYLVITALGTGFHQTGLLLHRRLSSNPAIKREIEKGC